MKTADINTIRARMAIGKKPHFVWGAVTEVHSVGEYTILEYTDSQGALKFHSYVGADDTCTSHYTLDDALVYAVAYKRLGCSSATHMSRAIFAILGMGD